MHKFFCNYNSLTQKYELSFAKGLSFGGARTMAENMLPEIRRLMQELYSTLNQIKDIEEEARQDELDQNELILSNLFYSLFASPLELEKGENGDLKNLYQHAISLTTRLEQLINIPEYNRSITLIKSSLQNIFNGL